MTSQSFSELIEAAQVHRNLGHLKNAIDVLSEARTLPPKTFRDWMTLSRSYFECVAYDLAVMCVQAAESSDPLQTEFGRIQQAMGRRDHSSVNSIAQTMLSKEPGHPRAVYALVHLHRMQGQHENCVDLLKQGLDVSPANLFLRQLLVQSHDDLGETQKAFEEIQKRIEIRDDPEGQVLKANFLFRHGRYEAAVQALSYIKETALNSGQLSDLSLLKGQIQKVLGLRVESEQAFQNCLKHNPTSGAAWGALADMKNYQFSADDQSKIEAILLTPNLSVKEKCQAGFALAKATEQASGIETAMPIYHRSNRLFPGSGFAPDHFANAIAKIEASFNEAALETQAGQGKTGPIFVLGMPRSGSTLVEQILASHSAISGTQELLCLPSVKRNAHRLAVQKYGGAYLDNVGSLEEADLSQLGGDYLRLSSFYHQNKTPFFIDKLPYNFEHIGLIHKILPKAIIIDTRRNPLDCGLSIYKQFFARGSEYSYNLAHIGAYYNGYLELMDHWDDVLPGKVFRVQYERLIEDTESHVSALLDHIGLEFEPACLKFYENNRAVRTASSEQVRQPINRKGIGLWRQVEVELQPLKDALGPDTLARFELELSL